MNHDICNAVIEDFAASEAELIERSVDLTTERDAYRLLAITAIHRLHDQHVELTRLREQHTRVIEEYRQYRAATITTTRAA